MPLCVSQFNTGPSGAECPDGMLLKGLARDGAIHGLDSIANIKSLVCCPPLTLALLHSQPPSPVYSQPPLSSLSVILAACGALAAVAVALLLLCCYFRARGKRTAVSTVSERAEEERQGLVKQMRAAAASLDGTAKVSDPPRRNLWGKAGALVSPAPDDTDDRFSAIKFEFGQPRQAVHGICHFLNVEETDVNAAIAAGAIEAIVGEVTRHGTDVDKECLEYVLHADAGSSDLTFQDGLKRDCGPDGALLECRILKEDIVVPSAEEMQLGEKAATLTRLNAPRGMRLDDFVCTPQAKHARLTKAHVVALRLYSTKVRRAFPPPAFHPFSVCDARIMRWGSIYSSTARSSAGIVAFHADVVAIPCGTIAHVRPAFDEHIAALQFRSTGLHLILHPSVLPLPPPPFPSGLHVDQRSSARPQTLERRTETPVPRHRVAHLGRSQKAAGR